MNFRLSHPELPAIIIRSKRNDLFGLCASAPKGNFAELGVYKGGTAWLFYQIAESRGTKLHLFDTFTGIPEDSEIDVLKKGQFSGVDLTPLRAHLPEAIFHIGKFPETAAGAGFSFVHIDCDQYVTAKAAIAYFWPRMVSGGIIAFDDYPEFPGMQKAIDEAFPGAVRFTEEKVPYVVKP